MVDKLEPFEILEEFEISPGNIEKGFFVKSFLMDETVNKNKWRVTLEAIKRDIHTYLDPRFSPVGKTMPFFLDLEVNSPEFLDHPKATETQSVFVTQERKRVGDMIAVGFDESLNRAWQASRIDDTQAQDAIRRGDVLFVSPGLRSLDEHEENGIAVVTRFIGEHIAGVDDPAYGIEKAMIVGTCDSDTKSCIDYFRDIKASSSSNANADEIKIGQCSKTGKMIIEIDKGRTVTPHDLQAALSKYAANTSETASVTSLKKSSATPNHTMTMSEQELKQKEDELNKKASSLEEQERKSSKTQKKHPRTPRIKTTKRQRPFLQTMTEHALTDLPKETMECVIYNPNLTIQTK